MDKQAPTQQPYNYFPVGTLGLVLALIGWGGLLYLVLTTYPNGQSAADMPIPDPANGWSYLADLDSGVMAGLSAFLVVALTGTSLPFVWFLNRRFSRSELPRPMTIIRQSVWVGVFAAVMVWLLATDSFSVPLMLITVGALALVEVLMLLRQQGNSE
jgi:hypothetical protein